MAAPLGNTFCGPGLFAKLWGDELQWRKKSLKLTAGCGGIISGKSGWLELPPSFPLETFAMGAASTCSCSSWVNSECIESSAEGISKLQGYHKERKDSSGEWEY